MGIAITKSLVREELDELKAALEKGKLPDVAAKINDELHLLDNTSLHIAIAGCSGAGKSSLVNALRGMLDYENGSAETGVTQTTTRPEQYQHPQWPNVTLWDLPGIGTLDFNANNYLKQVHFSQYDFFIIVAGDRFLECDYTLAREIKKEKKKFYYVRSKVDQSIDSESRKPNFNETETLQKIRNDCTVNLKRAGEHSAVVFLMTRWDLSKYDFPLLEKTLEEDLDTLKRHVLIMALPAFSTDIIERKMNDMLKHIWKMSFVSCAIGVVPIPGLSVLCDINILVSAMKKMFNCFGLDEESLRRLSNCVGIAFDELKSAIKKFREVAEITTEFVINILKKSLAWATVSAIEIVFDFIPVLGSLFGGVNSFVTIYYMLKKFLQDVVEDAQNVLKTVQERQKQLRSQ